MQGQEIIHQQFTFVDLKTVAATFRLRCFVLRRLKPAATYYQFFRARLEGEVR